MKNKKMIDRIRLELTRQHISYREYLEMLSISDAELTELVQNNQASIEIITKTAAFLGCSCDYICGISDETGSDRKHDERLGFTCKGRIKHLLEQLSIEQQWEVFEMISEYCLEKGVTYSRIDAANEREKIMKQLFEELGKLSA